MDSMEEIYMKHGKMIYGFLLTRTRDPGLAEELTQETFYQAVRSANRYDGSCKVSTWLCQIAKHLWYQEVEHRKRKGTSPLTEDIPSKDMPVEDRFNIREEKMELFRKVHVLDETAKEVVLLRVTGAFSFKEIGELFGKNENWARVTYYRAKQKIVKGGNHDEV